MLAIVLVSLLWRLPSLFDPPWVNDEGTYFAVARAMAHGFRLYVDIWENKPPGVYLVYSAVYHWFGASLLGIRLIAACLTAFLVVMTYRLALVATNVESACVAAMLVGLLYGVPFLEGTTLNAELPMSVLSACAVYAGLAAERFAVSGVCMVAALTFKAVAGFDAAALFIWLLLHRRTALPVFMLTAAASLSLGALIVWRLGILEPMVRDAFLYDLGYVGRGNGGSIPWLLGLKVLALPAITWALRRAPMFHLWTVWALVGALFSGRVFGHYALQAVVPVSLSAVLLLGRFVNRRFLIALPGGFLAAGLVSAAAGWSLAASGHDSILARRLQYYANFGRYALRTESFAMYSSQVDDHVNRNRNIAARLQRLPAGKILVWGNTPWIYVLSNRLPATEYTSALRQPEVPGETSTLRRALAHRSPVAVVVVAPAAPPLGTARAALRRAYRAVGTVDHAAIYVRSASIAPSVTHP